MSNLDNAQSLEELTELVCARLGCASTLVTHVTEFGQDILAYAGMIFPAQFKKTSPLSHSICQHTVAMDFPLVVDNTITHPLLRGNLAFQDLGIAAYLGAPVHMHEGQTIGALCSLELKPRRWSTQDIEIITQAAKVADRLLVRRV